MPSGHIPPLASPVILVTCLSLPNRVKPPISQRSEVRVLSSNIWLYRLMTCSSTTGQCQPCSVMYSHAKPIGFWLIHFVGSRNGFLIFHNFFSCLNNFIASMILILNVIINIIVFLKSPPVLRNTFCPKM